MILMHMHTSLFGFTFSDREHRLCHLDRAPGELPNLPGVDAIDRFLTNTLSRIGEYVNPAEANTKITRQNLANPRRWIERFRQAEMYTETQTVRDTLRGRAFGPLELLRTMSPQERVDQLYAFMEQVLPATVVAGALPASRSLPDDAAARKAFLDRLVSGTNVSATVLGLQKPNTASEAGSALLAFREIYPLGRDGGIFEDYLGIVRQVRQMPDIGGMLNDSLLGNRDAFLKLLENNADRLPPGRYLRFLGWLRVEEPKAAQERLNFLFPQLQRDELSRKQAMLQNQQKLEKLQKGPLEDLARMSRTATQNLDAIYAQNPALFYGIVATGLAAGYFAWTRGGFFGKFAMASVTGYYLYERVLNGNPNAFNDIAGNIQAGGRAAGEGARNLFRRLGAPPSPENEDLRRLQLMTRFLDERAFQRRYPAAVPMMAMAEVHMKHLARNAFSVTMAPGGRIEYVLTGPTGSGLHTELEGIVKRRRYDGDVLRKIFFDYKREISIGVATAFYQLAARQPGNRERVRRIEEARQADAKFFAGEASLMNYDNIRSESIKKEYLQMITDGQLIATSEYPDMSLIQIIEKVMTETPERRERPDNAESMPIPGTPPNNTREAERKLFAAAREPLVIAREPVKKLLAAQFEEFLGSCQRASFAIVSAPAADIFRKFSAELLADPTKSLQDIQLILGRLRYGILVGATSRTNTPMTVDDAIRMVGREGEDRITPGRIIDNITRYINDNLAGISAGFGRIDSINSVLTILTGTVGRGIETNEGGLKQLHETLTRHKARFERLRNQATAVPLFVNSIPATTVARFGGSEKEARERVNQFFIRMVARADYQQSINNAEELYANAVAEELVGRQLWNDRATGLHSLDGNPSDRFVSPTEEQNLMRMCENYLLPRILGTETEPLNGAWAGLALRQLSDDMRTTTMDVTNEASRREAVDRIRSLSIYFVALNPRGLEVQVLRDQVREIASRFLFHWTRIEGYAEAEAGLKKSRAEEEKVRKDLEAPRKKAVLALEVAEKEVKEIRRKTEEEIELRVGLGGWAREDAEKAAKVHFAAADAMEAKARTALETIEKPLIAAAESVKKAEELMRKMDEALEKHRESLTASYRIDVGDITSMMILLGMEREPLDRLLFTRLYDTMGITGTPTPAAYISGSERDAAVKVETDLKVKADLDAKIKGELDAKIGG